MIVSRSRRSPASAPLAFAAAVILALVSHTADALPAGDCGTRYVNCVDRASQLDGFWARSKAGLDCAANYVRCVFNITWM
jgi:hypothetical protein